MGIQLFINFFFGGEILMKIFAFGLRRTFRFSDWVVKVEFFVQVYVIFELGMCGEHLRFEMRCSSCSVVRMFAFGLGLDWRCHSIYWLHSLRNGLVESWNHLFMEYHHLGFCGSS